MCMTPQKSFKQYFENPQKSDKKVSCGNTCKVGCISPMAIWSDFRIRQYRDDSHREDVPHFTIRGEIQDKSCRKGWKY